MSKTAPNFKLIAVFAVPLFVVGMGLVASKKYIDVFEVSDELSSKVAKAKALGLPFEASDFVIYDPSARESRAALELRRFPAIPGIRTELKNPAKLGEQEMLPEMKNLLKDASILASAEALPATRDPDSYDFEDNYSAPRQAANVLVYAARFQANHGKTDEAIETLRRIPKLIKQVGKDPYITGLLVNASIQVIMYRGISEVSALVGPGEEAQQKLLELMDSNWQLQPLSHALKGEFYMQLSMLRNQLAAVLHMIPPTEAQMEEVSLDRTKPIQKSGLPKSVVAQALLSRLLDYYIEVFEALAAHSDPADQQLLLASIAENFAGRSSANKFVSLIALNASSACTVYLRQPTWKAITRWAIELHRDSRGKYPASLESRVVPGLDSVIQYRRKEKGFMVYSTGEDGVDEHLTPSKSGPVGGDDFGIEYPSVAKKD